MRCRIFGSALILAVVAIAGCASTESADVFNQPGIRANLESLNAVCATRDVAKFMALFEDNDDILFVGSAPGEVFRGRVAIAGFMTKLFALPFVFSFDMQHVDIQQHGRSAWVFVDGNMLHTRSDGQVSRMPYRFSIAMVKSGGAWRWQLFHGSVPGAE